MLEEDFYKIVEENIPSFKNEYKFISGTLRRELILEDKWGKIRTSLHHLLEGKRPTFNSAENPVEYIKNIIKDIDSDYEQKYEVVGLEKEKGKKTRIRVKTKYGLCLLYLSGIKEKKEVTIQSAENKQDYFKNILREKNKAYREGQFEVVGEYKRNNKKVKLQTKYGFCWVQPANLYNGDKPGINSAEDKTSYFLNNLKNNQPAVYDKYDYKDLEYIKNDLNVKVHCQEHGLFLIRPSCLLRGNGCLLCGYKATKKFKHETQICGFTHKSWVEPAKISKNFDLFKVYIIKCKEEDGTIFFKIGKTYKKLQQRFYKCNFPYKYEVVKIFEDKLDGERISQLEVSLKKENKKHKYTPKKVFGGRTECYKTIEYGL